MDDDGNPQRRMDDRQDRIQTVFQKLNASTGHKKIPLFSSFDFGDRTTYAVPPSTELLSRVQAFLPQMEASNNLLAQRVQVDPKEVDIENVNEGVGHYIEMNLGLGVFEDRAHSAAPNSQDTEMSTSSSDTSESDSESDSDVDTDASSEIITSFLPSRPIKPLPRRFSRRPQIIVLDEQPAAS
ncbi:hypothetical protein BD779DRAFT_1564154 [Infundibulicybe gibba]|nr:hypothetical protein BD779DRAFT_1564154 [Infundibulicybe gibba]